MQYFEEEIEEEDESVQSLSQHTRQVNAQRFETDSRK